MKKLISAALISAALLVGGLWGTASATPSTHIWSPSTDVQGYGLFHLTADMYLPVKADKEADVRPNTVTNLGLTVGVLPYEKLNLEVGFDHIAGYGDLDNHPMYFNAKAGIPENAYGSYFPALAAGGYMFGTEGGGEARAGHVSELGTDYNVYYVKAAKTFDPLGRFSVGYYTGNKKLLVDETGKEDNDGILLSWERTLSEISDKLWVAVDYMGGDSSFGVLSYGFSWKFAPNTSVIFGYVDQNNDKLMLVEDWFTMQVDIDFSL